MDNALSPKAARPRTKSHLL